VHPDIRQGSSVRGAIDCVLVARQLAELRGITSDDTSDRSGSAPYPAMMLDAMTVALSGRIHLDEAAETTPEAVLREIWEDHFILTPGMAEPG
jgi:MoxR-like ATPase